MYCFEILKRWEPEQQDAAENYQIQLPDEMMNASGITSKGSCATCTMGLRPAPREPSK